MKKIVELPLIPPLYSTYHNALSSATAVDNPSIRNWFLNQIMILSCNRKFLSGFTTPQISVVGCAIHLNPHLELHKKDYLSERGMRKILGKRQRLLAYLSKKNRVRYNKLIDQLNIREPQTR